jgi:hypothetical protein
MRPALRAILAAREPLPMEILQRLLNWQDEELRDFTRPIASIFPVIKESGQEKIKPYHKSLADWLGDEAKAGAYFVSVVDGHRMLADFGLREIQSEARQVDDYIIWHTPSHLQASGRSEESAKLHKNIRYLTLCLISREWKEPRHHPRPLRAMKKLAIAHFEAGNLSEAETLIRHVLAGCEMTFGPHGYDTLESLLTLGRIAWAKHDLVLADANYREFFKRSQENDWAKNLPASVWQEFVSLLQATGLSEAEVEAVVNGIVGVKV